LSLGQSLQKWKKLLNSQKEFEKVQFWLSTEDAVKKLTKGMQYQGCRRDK
jgi:hypothetical protein